MQWYEEAVSNSKGAFINSSKIVTLGLATIVKLLSFVGKYVTEVVKSRTFSFEERKHFFGYQFWSPPNERVDSDFGTFEKM